MSTRGDSDQTPKRRTVLGAMGTMAGLSVISNSTVADDGDDCPEWDPAAGGRTCSLIGHELPAGDDESTGSTSAWYESTITFQNCSTCTRLIGARVTDGHISDNPEDEPHASDQSSVLSYHIEAGERKTFWYTGSINNMDLSEPADLNVAITQRSINHAPTEQCYRSPPDSEGECSEGLPDVGGRTCSLKCAELPHDFHKGKEEPWYESSITFNNSSSCRRQIAVEVTEGHIHEDRTVEPHKDNQSRSRTYDLESAERKTFWFTGSVNFLDLSDHSDMNVAISQRSVEYAQSSRCNRP